MESRDILFHILVDFVMLTVVEVHAYQYTSYCYCLTYSETCIFSVAGLLCERIQVFWDHSAGCLYFVNQHSFTYYIILILM